MRPGSEVSTNFEDRTGMWDPRINGLYSNAYVTHLLRTMSNQEYNHIANGMSIGDLLLIRLIKSGKYGYDPEASPPIPLMTKRK